jgi:hypothetical protein
MLVMALGTVTLYVSTGIRAGMLANDPGPALLPMAAGSALVVLGLLLLISREPHDGLPRGSGLLRVVGTMALTLAYLNALQPWGFPAATLAFLTAQMLLVGVRNPLILATLPLAFTVLTYFLFRVLLSVPLPPTRLWGVLI